MTNLEWMYREYDGFAGIAQWWAVWEGLCVDSAQAEDWMLSSNAGSDDEELTVRNEASDGELFRCSYCHCEVGNIDMTEGDCGWGLTFCPQCGGEVDEDDSRRVEAELGGPPEEWRKRSEAAEAERDELREENDALREWKACYERMRAERDELEKRVDYLESRHCEWSDPSSLGDGCMLRKDEYVDALKAERDEWKAKAEQLANDTLSTENDVSDAQGEANDANAALLARIDELTVEKRTLEHELKLARGEVKTVLNNAEAAKRKAERAEAEYRERMRRPVEESWKREIELAKSSRDYYKAEMERLRSILSDVRKLAADREKCVPVTLADGDGSVVS